MKTARFIRRTPSFQLLRTILDESSYADLSMALTTMRSATLTFWVSTTPKDSAELTFRSIRGKAGFRAARMKILCSGMKFSNSPPKEAETDNDYSCEEVCAGGADVIPHYVTKRVAAGLRNFLRMAPNEIEFEGRTISRDSLLRAANILESGPTTIPW